jgi:hypothetical protein
MPVGEAGLLSDIHENDRACLYLTTRGNGPMVRVVDSLMGTASGHSA